MSRSPLVVSGSGIRGIFGDSLKVTDATRYAAAFGRLVGPGSIAVGRDARRSGAAMEAAVCAGLMGVGCTPALLGKAPTPTVQLTTMSEGYAGGIAITASHNPGEWNALKLIGPDGVFLRSDARERLFSILSESIEWSWSSGAASSQVVCDDAVQSHADSILSLPLVGAREDASGDGRLRAVVDPAGSVGALLARPLLERLGVDFAFINQEMSPDGAFPRGPEPVPGNLRLLGEAVRSEGADLGFAFDPDGDRLALVDSAGTPVGEEMTVALCLDFVLARRPGSCVINLSTSGHSEEAARRHGCELYRSPVGEVNVVEEMERRGARIGGEGNGGVIECECHPGRDAGVALAYVVSLLRENGSGLRELVDSFPRLHMMKYKEAIEVSFEDLAPALVREFGEPDDVRDGLWFRRETGFTHIRPSGTEPVVRLITEDADETVPGRQLELFRKVVERICVE
jgi:phosphomannomutase